MSDTCIEDMRKPEGTPARRIEVFTGAGRRRRWSAEEKAAIVAESYAGTDTASGVARRYGLTNSQLFAWRRAVRESKAPKTFEPTFVPVVVEAPIAPRSEEPQPPSVPWAAEIEIAGATVRIDAGAPAATISAVIDALRPGR